MPKDVMARVMEIVTPLGEDVLLFHGMSAREEMSRPFEYQLDLLSKKHDIKLDDILGKNVTIKLGLPDDKTRFFNGYVTRFAQGGMYGRYHRYLATVRPWLWFLTRTADCRIFQEMKVPDILKAVFSDHGLADFKFELTGTYRKWTYCVQYRETDFNFVSRLMEQEGIGYYFRHTEGHDTLVLTDSTGKHTPVAGYEKLSYIAPTQQVKPDTEHVHAWDFAREIQPGVYVHDDYDLERPSVELKTSKPLPRTYTPSDYEVYDYPGTYIERADGEQYAAIRINEMGTQFEAAHGSTNARGLTVGALLTLEHHEREDQNREYLIVSASYDLSFENYESLPEGGATGYRCTFAALPAGQQFRPRRITPKPFVQGPQTAVVVGPAGEEIYTDKYGRVKVQFHWDRRGKKDENSSCWIRVSSPWAGKNWGAVATPRIGQEVIVDFLEGDPDQPIITGRVYNAEQLPPFGFPAGAVISGVKSDTHKGSGNNEMSLDDTAGKERVFIHGQYNMDTVIEHDQTSTIHNCRTDRVDVDDSESIGNNQKWDVGVNRDATIGSNETLTVGANRTKKIGANETISVGSNRSATIGASESLTVALQRTHTVGINETISVGAAQQITVGAAQTETVGAAQTLSVGAGQTVSVGADQSTTIGAKQSVQVGSDQSIKVGGTQNTSAGADVTIAAGSNFGASAKADFAGTAVGKMALKADSDFSISGGAKGAIGIADELLIQCGSAKILLKKDGTIEIQGKDITLDGSGKVTVKASSDVVMKGSKILQN
jgi:type VI secretion system secreted protein VgrG